MSNEKTMKSFAVNRGIIDAMVEAKLDPAEFYSFMSKYAEFIEYGLIVKKIDALNSPEFDDLNIMQALSTGINCFDAFLMDFHEEFKAKSRQKPPTKKEKK